MDDRFEMAPVGVLEISPNGAVRALNDRAETLLEAGSMSVHGEPISETFPESVENTVPTLIDDGVRQRKQFEEYYPELDRWLELTVIPLEEGVVVYLQDVGQRHSDEQQIESLRGDLDRVTITNQTISDILAELVDASSREEIAATLCERLGMTDLYEFAWVGEREIGGDELLISASAGTTGRTLDEIRACLEQNETPPEQRAIETGTPETVQPLGQAKSVPESIRRGAFADGLQSLLAIPLTYGSSVYGVVGIYSADQDAFSEREVASFGTVGEMAGFAINAARHRNLLLSDTVVELTLALTDRDAPFVAASKAAKLTIDGIVPQGSELLCYVAVEDESPEQIAEAVTDFADVSDARVISEYESGGAVEVTMGDSTPLGMLSSLGGTIKRVEYTDGRGECTIELSPAEDVRRIVEAITREYDGEVIAKRQRERERTTPREFRETLSHRLTDRQENALRTAFFADYFESPRESTAEEVANALGITGPTLLHHLRAGQRKLLSEFFETSDRSQ